MSARVAITRTFASASISERVFRLLLAALVVIGASLSLFAQDITVSPATLTFASRRSATQRGKARDRCQ